MANQLVAGKTMFRILGFTHPTNNVISACVACILSLVVGIPCCEDLVPKRAEVLVAHQVVAIVGVRS